MVSKASNKSPRSRNVNRRLSVQKKEKPPNRNKISTKLEQTPSIELLPVKRINLQVRFESDNKMRRKYTYNLRGLPGEMSANQASEGRVRLFQELPGTYYKVVKNYSPTMVSHMQTDLTLEKGATVEVLFVGGHGMLEGRVKDKVGWFPASHVDTLMDSKGGKYGTYRSGGLFGRKMHRREGIPREVKLKRPKKNSASYGFIIKGAKASAPNFIPTPRFPALQYFDSVDKGGLAERAGLRPGDFILEFNSEDVRGITHADLVQKITDAKNGFTLKVMTPFRNTSHVINSTLPSRKLGGPLPPQRNPQTSLSLSRIKSPSLSQINFTGVSASEDDVAIDQLMTSAGALSLQDLFKPSSQYDTSATQQDQSPEEEQPTNHIPVTPETEVAQPWTPSGSKKLFVSAKNSGLSGKSRSSPRLCRSELDLRNLETSMECLDSTGQNSSTGNGQNKQDVNGNLLTVNSSSTVSLTVDTISSGKSTLLEEDEEAEIAAADGRQQIYANISNKITLNHHKPVIKSKSKELPPTTTQVPNNSSLKSAFYNRSKAKKPAPPPPKRGQNLKTESEFAEDDLADLKSNLIQSDIALSESTSISNISKVKSSFKPKKDTSNAESIMPDLKPEVSSSTMKPKIQTNQKDQIEVPQKVEQEFLPEERIFYPGIPDLPSPDYSDSEPELEISDDVEVSSQTFGAREKHSLPSDAISSHISSKTSYDSIQEAREQSLAELQQIIANQADESSLRNTKRANVFTDIDRQSPFSSNHSLHLEAQPELRAPRNSSGPLGSRAESTKGSYKKEKIELPNPEKASIVSKPTPKSSQIIFGSPTNIITSEKPTVVTQNKFHADLSEALLKRKSRLEFNANNESSFNDQTSKDISPVSPTCEAETVHQNVHPLKNTSIAATSQEQPVKESSKVTSRAEPEKRIVKDVPKRGVSKVTTDGNDEDVDALINQFYVAPPPDTLVQESTSSTFQQTCSHTSSSQDQKMATLRIKRKLAALNKENCEEHPRINLTQTRERMRTTPKVILFLKRGSLRVRLCKNLAQGYESASVSPDSTRSGSHLPVSSFLKQRYSSTSDNSNFSGTTDNTSEPCTHKVSGNGDRFSTNQRKGLSELLAEHIHRKKQSDSSLDESEQKKFHAQIRSSIAKEVLTKSQYPKSERLLQLINQPITSSKPSYLNHVIPTQAESVLPTKKSFQPPRNTTSFDSNSSASSSAGSPTTPKPPASPTPSTPETTPKNSFRNTVSHSYPRFSSSTKPGTLVSTPRDTNPPPKMDKPVRVPATGTNNSAPFTADSTNQIAALALDMQPVDDWGVGTVCEWLRSIQMSEYEPQFRSNDIAGSHLKMLTKNDLAELGINSLGHRLTIEKAIKQLPS